MDKGILMTIKSKADYIADVALDLYAVRDDVSIVEQAQLSEIYAQLCSIQDLLEEFSAGEE